MILVDTNVLAYRLIDGDRTEEAKALFDQDPDWRSESFLLIELSNVLATSIRRGLLATTLAQAVMRDAEATSKGRLLTVSHSEALRMASELSVTAYDARFLVAARTLGVPLVTEDSRLRNAAPRLTCSMADVSRK